ncbi:hypothetical protein MKW98_011371 [Papaver atlanticum]|uniref:Uncharacterized protein n=1 Tax=Papaver atlanticum TaxID=357466 RepID=A0AAD4XLH9_9MAGN|nr:hypothetical protein MKW98_011371 [Papaver atlanticum]
MNQRVLRTGGGTGSVRNIFWSANSNSYHARAERLLKTEAETIKEGDPQIIEEFMKFKKIYKYEEKLHAESLANIHAVHKWTSITVAVAIGISAVAYCFSLTSSKPQMEEKESPPPPPTISILVFGYEIQCN